MEGWSSYNPSILLRERLHSAPQLCGLEPLKDVTPHSLTKGVIPSDRMRPGIGRCGRANASEGDVEKPNFFGSLQSAFLK